MMRNKFYILKIAAILLFGLAVLAQAEWHFQPGDSVYEYSPNTSFTVEIILSGAGVDIDAFGFDVTFPNELLQYDDKDFAGTLLESWAFKEVNEYSPGVLKVAGFNVAEKITQPAAGIWVKLNFIVKEVAEGSGEFSIGNFGDDLLADGSTSTPASFNVVIPASVNIIFDVTVPDGTPAQDLIYIAGTFNSWDPGPGNSELNEDMPLTKVNNNQWQITLPFAPGENIEYKYTRGNWDKVEKGSAGEEIPNRVLVIPEDDITQIDTVKQWSDIPVSVHQQANNQIPQEYNLGQNYPNPFNGETVFEYQIPINSEVEMKIFNVYGQKIKTIIEETKQAGFYRVKWDGTDITGEKVSSGLYFCRIQAGDFHETIRVMFLK